MCVSSVGELSLCLPKLNVFELVKYKLQVVSDKTSIALKCSKSAVQWGCSVKAESSRVASYYMSYQEPVSQQILETVKSTSTQRYLIKSA